jgi:hypothetical protein
MRATARDFCRIRAQELEAYFRAYYGTHFAAQVAAAVQSQRSTIYEFFRRYRRRTRGRPRTEIASLWFFSRLERHAASLGWCSRFEVKRAKRYRFPPPKASAEPRS